MAFPKIGYRSIIETATLSGSVAAGFPLSNLVDRRVFTATKAPSLSPVDWDFDCGSNQTADYIGIISGNLIAENVTATLKGDTTFPPSTVRATVTPSEYPSSGVWMEEFGSASLRYWRLSLSAASANAAFVYVLYVGQILTLTEYLSASVDPNFERTEASIELGDTGNLLGAALRCKQREFDLDLGEAGMEWSDMIAANGVNDFYKNHASRMRPFFFHPNIAAPTNFEPTFMVKKADAGFNRPIVGNRYSRRRIILPMRSALGEAA